MGIRGERNVKREREHTTFLSTYTLLLPPTQFIRQPTNLEHRLHNSCCFDATAAGDVPVSRVGRQGFMLDRVEVEYGQVVDLKLALAVYGFLYRREGARGYDKTKSR